jgi:hypothetical protein
VLISIFSQFGNMLVLAATFNAELTSTATGKPLVEAPELKKLLDRTIRFLKLSEAISPTLERDAKILEHVRHALFSNQSFSATTSFSSA